MAVYRDSQYFQRTDTGCAFQKTIGNCIWRRRKLSTKTISDDFLRLRLRSLARDHDRMFSIS